jgi:hypothetical protein
MHGANSVIPLVSVLATLAGLSAAWAEDSHTVDSDKRALAGAQALVGDWRGVGQPKRGSNQGAWTEESQWAWRFADGRAELVGSLKSDKYFDELRLQAGSKSGEFVLLTQGVQTAGATEKPSPQRFSGSRVDESLVFTSDEPGNDQPARISLRLVAGGDRLLTLYEKRVSPGAYARLAEVGSTRKGSSFANASVGGPECIVTGGLGTIVVEHNGKKYYVCCTGCRDLFREDPEGVLAEYRQRKAAEAAEKN